MFLGDFLFKAAIQYQKHPRTPSRSKCSDRFREKTGGQHHSAGHIGGLGATTHKMPNSMEWSWHAVGKRALGLKLVPLFAPRNQRSHLLPGERNMYTHITYHISYMDIYIWLYRGLIQIISSAHGYFWWIINYLRETFGAPTFFFRGVVVIAFVLLRRAQITCM